MNLQRNIIAKFKENPIYYCLVASTILVAVYLRFFNYIDRLSIIGDNARDAQIAVYASDNLIFPQIGPFAQAPFFFGPWWYWFLELTYFLPTGILSPWFAMSFLSLVFLGLIYILANKIGDKWFALTALLIATFSPSAISNYLSIWNPTIIPILVTISLILFTKIMKDKSGNVVIFSLSFVTALATTIHFQTFMLTPIILIAIINTNNKLRAVVFAILGFVIPFLPFLIFDISHHWFWIRSFLIYTLIDQHSIYVPNRWITYLSEYWPGTWANVIGSDINFARVYIAAVLLMLIFKIKEIKKNKALLNLCCLFLLEIILFRYYGGYRQIYYGYFSYPFIIILTAWFVNEASKHSKLIATFILLIILILSYNVTTESFFSNKMSVSSINNLKKQIYTAYPNDKFNIYGCSTNIGSLSQPLALLMYHDQRNSLGGTKIGVCEQEDQSKWISLKDTEANSDAWYSKSTEIVYKDNLEWWKKDPPQKSDFIKFIIKKLSPKCYPHCS